MKCVLDKTTRVRHMRHDFDNGMSYVEIWRNNRLADSYFALAEDLFKDGMLRIGGRVCFHCHEEDPEMVTQERKTINTAEFRDFEHLWWLSPDGKFERVPNMQKSLDETPESV